jgi:hypothetical protein
MSIIKFIVLVYLEKTKTDLKNLTFLTETVHQQLYLKIEIMSTN